MDTSLVRSYFELQRKLVSRFESVINIKTPSNELLHSFPHLSILNEEKNVSHIVESWPIGKVLYPMSAWVEPRKGIIDIDSQKWLYVVHGSLEISFQGIPDNLVKEHRSKAILIDNIEGEKLGPVVEISYNLGSDVNKYLGGTLWQIYIFINSVANRNVTESDVLDFLNNLVDEKKLIKVVYDAEIKYFPA